jgi:hypothetical protein
MLLTFPSFDPRTERKIPSACVRVATTVAIPREERLLVNPILTIFKEFLCNLQSKHEFRAAKSSRYLVGAFEILGLVRAKSFECIRDQTVLKQNGQLATVNERVVNARVCFSQLVD